MHALTVQSHLKQVLASVRELKNVCARPISAIWSSPYLRARQSAEIAAQELDLEVSIQGILTPDYNPSRVTEWLYKQDQLETEASILLVSHMPLVGNLVSLLVHGNTHQPAPFYTGMITQLFAECAAEGCFTISHTIQPKL